MSIESLLINRLDNKLYTVPSSDPGLVLSGYLGADRMQHRSQVSYRDSTTKLHLFHPLLLTYSHPAGLSLIKTMLGESHSHLEGDCSLLLPDCCDWLHYRIILENCFFYESKTCSSPFSLGCYQPCCPEVRKTNKKTKMPEPNNGVSLFYLR